MGRPDICPNEEMHLFLLVSSGCCACILLKRREMLRINEQLLRGLSTLIGV